MKIKLPKDIRDIIGRLENRGFSAYVVGGCVRDSVMGRPVHDWDVCTSALPEEIEDCFKDRKLLLAGKKHGTVAVILGGTVYEITTFRTDGQYTDRRHPDSVSFIPDVEGDLARRDFTVNAMAYSEKSGIVDAFGGIHDLQSKVIRCVGEPSARFGEDALRIMRALRFAAVLGFSIEKNTADTLLSMYNELDGIASERITEELRKLLCAPAPSSILRAFSPVFAHILDADSEHIEQYSSFIDKISPCFAPRLALLCGSTERLRLSSAEARTVRNVRKALLSAPPTDRPSVKRAILKFGEDARAGLEVLSAVEGGELLTLYEDIKAKDECCTLKQLDINGKDLVELGITGKNAGATLEALLDDVIDGAMDNKKQKLISRAKELF